jgi:hypothetical protein
MCSISEITDDNALHNNGCLKNVRHEMFAQQLVLAHKFVGPEVLHTVALATRPKAKAPKPPHRGC